MSIGDGSTLFILLKISNICKITKKHKTHELQQQNTLNEQKNKLSCGLYKT
jgi:hypothetical protein